MKRPLLCVLLQIVYMACYAQDVAFDFGTPFQRADLDVRWNAPSNSLPSVMWVYRALPTKFSPAVISNLMELGSFRDKDKADHGTNVLVFESTDKSRRLWIYVSSGVINYEDKTASHFGTTNASVGVPSSDDVLQLTADFLPKLGINPSEISRKKGNSDAEMHVYADEEEFYVNKVFMTNIPFRGVRFRRALDGAKFLGNAGGDFQIEFGDHGKICKLDLTWQQLEREKAFHTATRETIIKWMREGKAVQNIIFTNISFIDWAAVQSVTVHETMTCYHGQNGPDSHGLLFIPYVALDTTVDTAGRMINVELDCPIIDESKPLNSPEAK